jgi:hypothetical protein
MVAGWSATSRSNTSRGSRASAVSLTATTSAARSSPSRSASSPTSSPAAISASCWLVPCPARSARRRPERITYAASATSPCAKSASPAESRTCCTDRSTSSRTGRGRSPKSRVRWPASWAWRSRPVARSVSSMPMSGAAVSRRSNPAAVSSTTVAAVTATTAAVRRPPSSSATSPDDGPGAELGDACRGPVGGHELDRQAAVDHDRDALRLGPRFDEDLARRERPPDDLGPEGVERRCLDAGERIDPGQGLDGPRSHCAHPALSPWHPPLPTGCPPRATLTLRSSRGTPFSDFHRGVPRR